MERVIVFIDGSNFYHGLKESFGHARADFRRFCDLVCGSDRRLVHVHYYNVALRQADNPEQYAGQQRFFGQLRLIPYLTVHLGRLVDRHKEETCPKCSEAYTVEYQTEKGVDVQIASHMLVNAFDNQYDTAILISQDGDFAPVVAEILRLNKQVENADFPHRLPSYLSRQCSRVIRLDKELLEGCMF
jgi:uncharacterized LabA/DUF88 family protein